MIGLYSEEIITNDFLIEGNLAATRTTNIFKAQDKKNNYTVSLCVGRYALARESESVKAFYFRMRLFQEVYSEIIQIHRFGVDKEGYPFAVLPSLDGGPLSEGNRDFREIERRFTSCIRLVDRLQQGSLICGDLCDQSFWVDRSGELRFIGVMGSYTEKEDTPSNPPPSSVLFYLSPEQVQGMEALPSSDVFALGVLGYNLITDNFPYPQACIQRQAPFSIAQIPPLTDFQSNPPVWAEEVLKRCLEPRPDARYGTAKEILDSITEVRQRILSETELPTQSQSRKLITKRVHAESSLINAPMVTKPQVQTEKSEPKPVSRVKRLEVVIAVVAVFVISLFVAWGLMSKKDREGKSHSADLSLYREAVDSNQPLREAIDVIGADSVPEADLEKKLEQFISSDDPLAHNALVEGAVKAPSRQIQEKYEKALIDRVRRMGMVRSAEQLRQWLRSIGTGALPDSYAPLLKALNTTLPDEARDTELREAYPSNPKATLRLASALALDSKSADQYQPLLSQVVGDALHMEDAKEHSALSLILVHPELALIFGDDVVQRRADLPDADIIWLLKVLAERNDLNVRAFASLAVERGVLSPLRQVFLTSIRDREDLPVDVISALTRASAGALRVEDLAPLGRWYDLDAEKLLLAMCADDIPVEVRTEAFDILAGKSLTMQPSAKLVNLIRGHYWQKRGEFARVIGVLAYLDAVSEKDIEATFSILNNYSRDARLINLLLDSGHPVVTKYVVDHFATMMSLGVLLNLLSHSDKEVRIGAIHALKGTSEIGALKIVIDKYEAEKDEEVKKVYQDSFWVIQNRK